MYTKDLRQAITILRKAGIDPKTSYDDMDDQDSLLEFTLKNLEAIKKTKNPLRYLEEKIAYLESLYGKGIWRQRNSPNPLLMLDSCKAGILKALQEDLAESHIKK